jgi:serine/threonine protein kinase
MDDRRSDRFGRYEILSELGRGAMGIVYKARDPRINRIVAVKTISLAGQPLEEERDFRERFFREAQAAGRLSHPGIITVFDAGEEPDTHIPYIVMEFVGGQSLDKLLSESDGKIPLERALQITLELAAALDCAHSQDVVHRDLKPENIILTEDGHAKIADFGVAKLNLSNLTLVGRAMGTPSYMSPEQLSGETVDGRSDLFSLGVILYTMLTGYKPFQGNSPITISYKVVNREPVAASVLDSALPPELDRILARSMAKNPAERYQCGADMVLDIQHLQNGKQGPGANGKQAVASGNGDALQTPRETAQLPDKSAVALASRNRSSSSELSSRQSSIKSLKEQVRRKSYIGVLLLAGFLALSIWDISFGPKRMTPNAAAPPPVRQVVSSVAAPPGSETGVPASSFQGADENTTAPASPVRSNTAAPTPTITPVRSAKSRPVPVTTKPAAKTVLVARNYVAPRNAAKLSASVIVAEVPAAPPEAPPATLPPATLEIEVEHKFAEGKLVVLVDDLVSYTHALQATDKKHLVVFHHMQGHEFHAMQIPAGKHHLRVQVTSTAAPNEPAVDKFATLDGEFTTVKDNVLRIVFDKHGEMIVTLQ